MSKYKSDLIFESMSPKEAMEFTGGYDKEKINLLKEIKATARKEKELEKYALSNKPESKGAFQREVNRQKANGTYGPGNKELIDTINKYEDGPNIPVKIKKDPPIMERRGEQTLALKQIGKKVLDQGNLKAEDVELKLNENGLHTNKDRTIAVRDSFVANAFNKSLGIKPNYPTQASPKAFGQLAERLEKDRQMRGEPTNVQRFKKNFNNINSQKPIIKKPIKRTGPVEPVKINFDNYKPFVMPTRIEEDPQSKIMEARFKEIQQQTHDEKVKRETTGLAGLLGGGKKFI